MNSTLKNKKVVAGVGVAAAAAAVLAVGAGTYAGFLDTETGPDTTLAAGTVFFGQSVYGNVSIDKLAPGGPAAVRTFTYENGGNQRGDFAISFGLTGETEGEGCAGGADGPEADAEGSAADCATTEPGELDDQVRVVLTADGGDKGFRTLHDGSVAGLDDVFNYYENRSQDPVTFTLSVSLPDIDDPRGGNNAAQGDTFTLSSTATLERPVDPDRDGAGS